MNILPKKKWHVRTKENIARVRRDEAIALEEEKVKNERIQLAEREARRELLLKRNRSSNDNFLPTETAEVEDAEEPNRHINFFEELEEGTAEQKQINKEHEKEKKDEKEKYEKQIGYLTYLGQDTNEALGKKNWYDMAPDRSEVKNEVNLKSKISEDPLTTIRKLNYVYKCTDSIQHTSSSTSTTTVSSNRYSSDRSKPLDSERRSHRHKKHKKSRKRRRHSSSESSEDDRERSERHKQEELLRTKRLRREKEERLKTEALLDKLNPKKDQEKPKESTSFKAKYNTQFNPYLAKQNYS